jgi:hypothetical protein
VATLGLERLAAALLIGCLHCAGGRPAPLTSAGAGQTAEVTRYRLLLQQNPVDPGQALRCYGACQSQDSPEKYLSCLAECPGFEQTPGVACAPNEVPPFAACFTARPLAAGSEPNRSSVVIAVVGDIPLVVGLASVCASQTEPCAYTGGGLVP